MHCTLRRFALTKSLIRRFYASIHATTSQRMLVWVAACLVRLLIPPRARHTAQVVRSGLNALNSVFSNEAARSEATDLKAALHLIAVLRAAQEREDKHSIKFALQAIAQLAAHNEEDWFLVKVRVTSMLACEVCLFCG